MKTLGRFVLSWLERALPIVNFLASLATVIGVLVVVPELRLINKQLAELDSKAKVEVELVFATSTLSIGDVRSEPISLFLTAYNSRDFVPSFWRVSILFCNDISILESDSRWTSGGNANWFFLDSQRPLPSNLMIRAIELDEIGNFKVTLPVDHNHKLKNTVPIAIVYASGERNESKPKLVSLDSSHLIYEDIETLNGKILSNLRGCKIIQNASL